MKINKGYKVELKPNNKQRMKLLQHAGAARFVYNWGLAQRINLYKKEKKSTSAPEQHRELNKLKSKEFPWLYEVSKCAPQEALRDLDTAFKNFFRNIKKKKKAGFPKFKSKKKGIGSFRLTGSIHVESNRVKLPRLGWIRLKEKDRLPISSPSTITVSEKAGHWFVSLHTEKEVEVQKIEEGEILGIDLGINHLATCSDGQVFDSPKSLKKNLKNLKRAQQSLSRKQDKSKNREKAKKKVQKIHYRIANIRKDSLHKITSLIAKTKPKAVILEDLNTSGMMKNHCLARSIQDAGFSEFRRQSEYKLKWIGSKTLFVDRFYPSSKICSHCRALKKTLSLSDRVFVCNCCKNEIDRDLNASLNLKFCYDSLSSKIPSVLPGL